MARYKRNFKSTRDASSTQEHQVADGMGIRVQPNSGASAFQKGDLKGDHILLECKTLMKPQKTVTIRKEWLTKIKEEQFQMRRELSGLVFDFGDGDNYVILTLNDFKELFELFEKEFDE